MQKTPFTIERTFDAPIEKVWQAITDKDQMKQWYFDLEAFRPEVGFEFKFLGGDDKKKWWHICRVTEAVPLKKLSHTWRYEGYPGDTQVTWELAAEGNKTRVKLTHSGLETLPADVPEFAKENFEQGWKEIIGKSLPNYLEKQTVEH